MKSPLAPGIQNGKLTGCPASPNCICTEYPNDPEHFSEPVSTPINASTADLVIETALAMGGKMQARQGDYLAFTFTSKFFRFVDDFEVRLDAQENLLHIRSASRVGYSDLGVNRRRIERFKAALADSR